MVYPAPADDPDRNQLKGRAVGRVLRNFAAAGAELAIVSGVIEPADVAEYRRECHGCSVTFVRLALDRAMLVDRLKARYGDDDVDRALALDARLDASDFAAATVDATGHTPVEVARRIRAVQLAAADDTGVAAQDRTVGDAPGVCVWVHGAPAIGKSSVGWALFRQLITEGGAGYLDLQQLSFIGAGVATEPTRLTVQAVNVAAVWELFAQTGARWLVLSGAMPQDSDLRAHQDLLPDVDFRPVRLTASDSDLRARVLQRALGTGPTLAGDHLVGQPRAALEAAAAAAQLADRRLEVTGPSAPVIDTTGLTVEATVSLVRQAVGIPRTA